MGRKEDEAARQGNRQKRVCRGWDSIVRKVAGKKTVSDRIYNCGISGMGMSLSPG